MALSMTYKKHETVAVIDTGNGIVEVMLGKILGGNKAKVSIQAPPHMKISREKRSPSESATPLPLTGGTDR